MLRFPHGIRQAFLRPVWAPFRRCLPLLALLQSCPEDGDDDELLTNKAQHDDGDLLPKASGVEEVGDLLPLSGEDDDGDLLPKPSGDDDGDLLPLSGEDEVGDLLPQSGDANGEGIPPSQGNVLFHNTRFAISKIDVLKAYDFISLTPDTLQAASATEFTVEEGVLLPTAHAKPMLLITQFQGLQFQPIHVFDPGGFLHLREPHSGVEMGILPPPHVTKKHDILLYLLMVGDFDPGGYHLLHPTFLSYALLTPAAAILHGFYTSIWLRGSNYNMRNVASLHNIYIDDKNANCSSPASPRLQAAADAGSYFLIPLRGRRCDQWNDEVEHEDVAASKMKTKRTRKLMRLFYLTKDVLDPG